MKKSYTLNEVQIFLEERGIASKIKTVETDTGSMMFYVDVINIKHENKALEISPDYPYKIIAYEQANKPDYYNKVVIDKDHKMDLMKILTIEKLPDESYYPFESHVYWISSLEELEEKYLKDFLELKLEGVQMDLFSLEQDEELDEIEM